MLFRSVATKAPELALDGAGGGGVGSVLVARKQEVRDVVHDADGELALGIVLLELGIDCEGISGRGVLGTETIAAADNLDVRASNGRSSSSSNWSNWAGTPRNWQAAAKTKRPSLPGPSSGMPRKSNA